MKYPIRLLSIVMFLWLCLTPVLAQQYQELEAMANEGAAAYEQRDFRQAIALWEQVLTSAAGKQTNVYYNLARAYEQVGEWGDARLHDLWAKLLIGWVAHPDLDAALERGWARQDLQTLHPLVWLKRTLREISRPLGLGLLGAVLWIGLWLTVIVYIRRRVGRWIMAGFAAGMMLWGGVVATNIILDRVLIDAVSFEPTPIYTGPGADYALLATWVEGYDLYIVATKGDWVQVWRADGMSGWLEKRLIWEAQHIDPMMY